MSAPRKFWGTAWRVGLGLLLLLWVFNRIFLKEAQQKLTPETFDRLPWTEQWQQGWQVGPGELARTLGQVGAPHFVLSLVLMGATLALGMARWRLALRVQGLELSWGRTAEISFVAHFFNSFLLGSNGGDLMKAWYAARETHHKKTEAVLTVVVDRLIGLWAMLLFACVMIVFNFRLFSGDVWMRLSTGVVLGMTLTGSAGLAVAFWGGVSKKWSGARAWLRRLPKGEWLERTLDSCRLFGRTPLFVPKALGVSMLLNAACVLQFIALAGGMKLAIPPLVMFAAVPIVICISALPITPNGVGVREGLFVQMLGAIGVDSTSALSLSLLAYAGSLFWSLVGGVVYMTLKERHHLAEAELEKSGEA